MNRRGIIGGFISMFVATVIIVLILFILIIASGIVKKVVRNSDNFGIYDEGDSGIDDVFDYMDDGFSDMTQLRIAVKKGGDWGGLLGRMGK